MAYASAVDLDEAYRAGAEGDRAGGDGPERLHGDDPAQPGPGLHVRYDKVPLAEVANSERTFRPVDCRGGCDVTDDFMRYARPLVGNDMISLPIVDGRQRLARLKPPTTPSSNLPRTCRRRGKQYPAAADP